MLCCWKLTLLAEYGIWIIAWCFFALTCGGFIKGALGVGTPLLTVPMMAQVLPTQMAIAIMAIPVVVANIWQFTQAERSTEVVERFWPTFIAILIGTWFGVKILATIDEGTLMFLVGFLKLDNWLSNFSVAAGVQSNISWSGIPGTGAVELSGGVWGEVRWAFPDPLLM